MNKYVLYSIDKTIVLLSFPYYIFTQNEKQMNKMKESEEKKN